jgi:hypothetical protein
MSQATPPWSFMIGRQGGTATNLCLSFFKILLVRKRKNLALLFLRFDCVLRKQFSSLD